MEILFKEEKDITDSWLNYMEAEVNALMDQSEQDILAYMDREILNPQMDTFLMEGDTYVDLSDMEEDELSLDMKSAAYARKARVFDWFRRLKRKIRQIICSIWDKIKNLPIKEIIKKILEKLLGIISGGIPGILKTIIEAIVALILKKGSGAICVS